MSALGAGHEATATFLLAFDIGDVNNIVGVIGGTILCLELLGLLLVLIAINGGLALGLRWVLGKMGLVHAKTTWAAGLVDRYANRAMNILAVPVITGTSVWRGVKAGLYRFTHWPASAGPTLPAPSKALAGATSAEIRPTPGPSRAA